MNTELKIDRGVPIPKSRRKLNQKPWCDMQVGDSVFVPAFELATPTGMSKLRKSLMHIGHKYWGSGGYSVLASDHNGLKGFRVWRRK